MKSIYFYMLVTVMVLFACDSNESSSRDQPDDNVDSSMLGGAEAGT